MGRSNPVWPAGWWAEPSPACRGPSVRVANSSQVLAAPSDLLVTLAGGKHVALLSIATAVAPFLRMVLVLVTPGNERRARGACEETRR